MDGGKTSLVDGVMQAAIVIYLAKLHTVHFVKTEVWFSNFDKNTGVILPLFSEILLTLFLPCSNEWGIQHLVYCQTSR